MDYEKSHNVRLTQEIRRIQSQAAMDTTSFGLGSKSASQQSRASSQASCTTSSAASTNTSMMTTSATSDSPVWSSGSGALKEIRLYDAELKVKSLEKENSRLKEHEEFYINKAREWKNRALKYERTLQDKGIPVPTRDKGKNQVHTGCPPKNFHLSYDLYCSKVKVFLGTPCTIVLFIFKIFSYHIPPYCQCYLIQ